MAIRQFVFCDICNPQGHRSIEHRRGLGLDRDIREGRRINDGRVWFEGDISEAVASEGWLVTEEGKHVCPRCNRK